jgi:hypothetical protein
VAVEARQVPLKLSGVDFGAAGAAVGLGLGRLAQHHDPGQAAARVAVF